MCPKTWTAIITNPVNSTVPIAAEVLKAEGCYDPRRLFGVTTLDVVRARTFIADILSIDPKHVRSPRDRLHGCNSQIHFFYTFCYR